MGKGERHEPIVRATDEQLIDAIKLSGYPFEVSVFERLKALGLHPAHGVKVYVDSKPAEIDVLASIGDLVDGVDLSLRLLIECKVFHAPKEFIAFPAATVDGWSRAVARMRLAGVPTFNVLSNGGVIEGAMKSVIEAAGVLPDIPWSTQWALYDDKQEGKGDKRRKVENHGFNAIEKMSKIALAMGQEASIALLGSESILSVAVELPVVVVDVPDLCVFDTGASRLSRVPWVTVHAPYDFGGNQWWLTCDVISASHLETYVKAMVGVFAAMAASARDSGTGLRTQAAAQRSQYARARQDALFAQVDSMRNRR